jgi:hypothetical protein
MDIPLEIWKEISLSLPYNFLAISTKLIKIYDESWFEKKIKIKYPNCKQYNKWEFLYKRSLKSGEIYKYDSSTNLMYTMNVEGIKISSFGHYTPSILTFDGDLYIYDIIGNCKLIDNNVLDFDKTTYIKNNEWYRRILEEIYFITFSNETFISCLIHDGYSLAITSSKIYQYDNILGKLVIIDFDNAVKIISTTLFVIIQKKDGSLYKYNTMNKKIKKIDIEPVSKLFTNCVKSMNGDIMIFNYNNGKIGWIKNILTPNNDLRGVMSCFGILSILIGEKMYEVGENYELKIKHENVKNINDGYLII